MSSSLYADERKKKAQGASTASHKGGVALTPPDFTLTNSTATQMKAQPVVQRQTGPDDPKYSRSSVSGINQVDSAIENRGMSTTLGEKKWGDHEPSSDKPTTVGDVTKTTLYSTGTSADAKAAVYDQNGLEALSAGAKASAGLNIGSNGIEGKAKAEANAMLARYNNEWQWPILPHSIFGEDMQGKVILAVDAFVGAEAAAQIQANVGKMAQQGEDKVTENQVKAGIEGFAGAKVNVGGGIAYEWKKKPKASYKNKLKQSASYVMDVVTMANPILGVALRYMGGEAAAEWLLNQVWAFGSEGTVPLLSALVSGEASAGVGGKLEGSMGFKGGMFRMKASAKGTWGLGAGASVDLGLNALEGPMFALICAGQFREQLRQFLANKAQQITAGGLQLYNYISDWLFADDRVREMVSKRIHEVASVRDRVDMINTMLDGWCGDADEQAILKILRHAKRKGDMNSIVYRVGRSRLLSKLNGREHYQLLSVLS